jgi:hypothetical protein
MARHQPRKAQYSKSILDTASFTAEEEMGGFREYPLEIPAPVRLQRKRDMKDRLKPPTSLCFRNTISDDGSAISSLTTSTTRSRGDDVYDCMPDDEQFFPKGGRRKKQNSRHKEKCGVVLPFEALEKMFYKLYEAILDEEAMMNACQDDPSRGNAFVLNKTTKRDADIPAFISTTRPAEPSEDELFAVHKSSHESRPDSFTDSFMQPDAFFLAPCQNQASSARKTENKGFWESFKSSSLSVDGSSLSIANPEAAEPAEPAAPSEEKVHDEPSDEGKSIGDLLAVESVKVQSDDCATTKPKPPEGMFIEVSQMRNLVDDASVQDKRQPELRLLQTDVFHFDEDDEPEAEDREPSDISGVYDSWDTDDSPVRDSTPHKPTPAAPSKIPSTKRRLGLRYLLNPRVRNFSFFSWGTRNKKGGNKKSDDRSNSPDTVTTTTNTVQSDASSLLGGISRPVHSNDDKRRTVISFTTN